jgi:hypothetical protein
MCSEGYFGEACHLKSTNDTLIEDETENPFLNSSQETKTSDPFLFLNETNNQETIFPVEAFDITTNKTTEIVSSTIETTTNIDITTENFESTSDTETTNSIETEFGLPIIINNTTTAGKINKQENTTTYNFNNKERTTNNINIKLAQNNQSTTKFSSMDSNPSIGRVAHTKN